MPKAWLQDSPDSSTIEFRFAVVTLLSCCINSRLEGMILKKLLWAAAAATAMPAAAHAEWVEASSEHFLVYGDMSQAQSLACAWLMSP